MKRNLKIENVVFMNITGEYITHSDEETFALGEKIGAQLESRTIFLLSGDLGAGKTVFAKGIAAGLGIEPVEVTSPTFTLINEYEGRLRFYHIDLYRLETGMCQELGIEEMFEEKKSVVLIEWAERLGFTPDNAIKIHIEYLSDTERKIQIAEA
jgi:tRNA threonylcarbamoyladenosine biosynthesis protein TsaE